MGKAESLALLTDPKLVDSINKITSIDQSFDSLLEGIIERQTADATKLDKFVKDLTTVAEVNTGEDAYNNVIKSHKNFYEYTNTLYQRMVGEVCDFVKDFELVVDKIPGPAAKDEDTPSNANFFEPQDANTDRSMYDEVLLELYGNRKPSDDPNDSLLAFLTQTNEIAKSWPDVVTRINDLTNAYVESARQMATLVKTYAETESYTTNKSRYNFELETHNEYRKKLGNAIGKLKQSLQLDSEVRDFAGAVRHIQPNNTVEWATSLIDVIASYAMVLTEGTQLEKELLAVQDIKGAGKLEKAQDRMIGILVKADEKLFPEHTKVAMPAGRERNFIGAYKYRAESIFNSGKAMATPDMNSAFVRTIEMAGKEKRLASDILSGEAPIPSA